MSPSSLKRRLVGGGLIALFVLGAAALLAGWHVDRAYRHVSVEAFNVNDVARVSVNCQRARTVDARAGKRTVDLGWLDPDDRISLSGFNEIGDASWGFRIKVAGEAEPIFERWRGQADAAGFAAEEWSVVMAKSFTADGDPLGTVGCDPPLNVSDELGGYRPLPDDTDVETTDGERERWDAPTFPFAAIEFAAAWALPVLALIGFAAAIGTAEVRLLVRRHWKIGLGIGLLSLSINLWGEFGLGGLICFAEGIGVVLLLASAFLMLWPHTASRWLTSSSTPAPGGTND